ncbi:MAG: glycogen synthase GlgA [Firmicutes bacterium]|nr:glycogen synthase GlgA [Bacillota bacterium]
MNILFAASEVTPFAKSGGLADVSGSLPKALKKLGINVCVVMPKYKSINQEYLKDLKYLGGFETSLSWRSQRAEIYVKEGFVPVYFIENEYYFGRDGFYGYGDDNERFTFFDKAVIEMLPLLDFVPDVIHCNDWQTGLIPMLLKKVYNGMLMLQNIKTVYTIHNLQYQGNFPSDSVNIVGVPLDGDCEFYGQFSFMKCGLKFADIISTVSKTYSHEICTYEYGYGMDGILRERQGVLKGIQNGLDYEINDPETDDRIYKHFSAGDFEDKKYNKKMLQEELGLPQRNIPLISIVSRFADQKGFDILGQALDEIMNNDIQLVVLGTGEARYEDMLRYFADKYSGKISVTINFDDVLAQKIYAGSDMFLMPSKFEPCGLGQIISLRYGAVPIVRKTGGLADTITNFNPETGEGNGFVFENYDAYGLIWGVSEALRIYGMGEDVWKKLVYNAMTSDFSWENSAKEYIETYENLTGKTE